MEKENDPRVSAIVELFSTLILEICGGADLQTTKTVFREEVEKILDKETGTRSN